MPGPPPKRSEERRRRNNPAAGPPEKLDVEAGAALEPDTLPFLIAQPIVVPQPGPGVQDDSEKDAWHPIALEMWESFKRSGQALLWEPSDWMVAKLMCESISRDLKPQVVGVSPASEYGPAEAVYEKIPLKGASLGAYLKAFGQLMLTEGERRRLSIELQRTREKAMERGPARVVRITDRKAALAGRKVAGESQ